MSEYWNNAPQELRELRQWIVWREEVIDGKKNKTPYQSLHPDKKAATTRSREWSTFQEAVDCANDAVNGMSGIGFIITRPYIFLDIDHCAQENGFNEMFYGYMDVTAPSYAELSQNDGVHILGKGNCPTAAIKPTAHEHVELYTHDRYVAFTGKVIAGRNTLENWTDAQANEIYAHTARQLPKNKEQQGNLKLSRDERFRLLLNGEMREAGFTDASAAVHSLLIELAARNNNDKAKMEEAFLASRLYTDTAAHWQKKWKRLRETELENAVTHARSRSSRRSAEPDDPNAIALADGHLIEILSRCERVLTDGDNTEKDLRLFSRKRQLVRPVTAHETDPVKGVDRDNSSVIIAAVSSDTLVRTLADNASFMKPKATQWVETDPDTKYARHLIDRVASGEARCYRELQIVTDCPCLLSSGAVLDTPGYREGVLYCPNRTIEFPTVAVEPSRDDAVAALDQFRDIFCECAFVENLGDKHDPKTALATASFSAVLAAVLSLAARAAVPTVPLTIVNAPKAGSAKSKTVEAICICSRVRTAQGDYPRNCRSGRCDVQIARRQR